MQSSSSHVRVHLCGGHSFFCREKFFAIVQETTQQHFKAHLDKLLKHLTTTATVTDDTIRGLFFGDYMIPGAEPRVYDEVSDFKELTSAVEK